MKKQIIAGDSTRGYTSAEIEIGKTGKARLVPDTISGTKSIIKKCIANYNRGLMSYVTSAGDELPFSVR